MAEPIMEGSADGGIHIGRARVGIAAILLAAGLACVQLVAAAAAGPAGAQGGAGLPGGNLPTQPGARMGLPGGDPPIQPGALADVQDGDPPTPADTRLKDSPGERVSPLPGLRIDRAGRRVILDASVSLQAGALEFLLCTEGTKDYESLLTTKVQPSSLHAALLALGLTPGRPARWMTPAGKEPVFVSPRGAGLEITVRWTDGKGLAHDVPATDLMLAAGTGKTALPTRWVFVGSDMLDNGRYWADVEGHHISVANFTSSVIDVPFRSSDKDAFLEFSANPATTPSRGTAVELVIEAVKGAETAPAARISFSLDRLGRIELDGVPIAPETIAAEARKFLSRHAEGSADVRIDPRALVFDRERLRIILERAGLSDVDFRVKSVSAEILPRTPDETAKAIAWWQEQLASRSDSVMVPAKDAAATLRHIERRRKQVEDLSGLWSDYAAGLQAALDEHRKARQEESPEEKGSAPGQSTQ